MTKGGKLLTNKAIDQITVNIVDCVMGSGKSSAAINYINSLPEDVKVIYITPYITEVDRIIEKCSNKNFKQPINYTAQTPKIVHLKKLLNNGNNIVTTHALFHYFDDEIIDLCYSQGYILFMDEVTNVVDLYSLDKKDTGAFLKEYVTVDEETSLLKWNSSKKYSGKFIKEKRLCDLECLVMYGGTMMLWMFPVKIFTAFRESYILTYMFNAQPQKYYYDYYGIKYNYVSVAGDSTENYHFVDGYRRHDGEHDYGSLIKVFNERKLNMIGDLNSSLSKGWFERNKDNILVKQLRNNVYNFFNNKKVYYDETSGQWIKSKSSNNIWTTFRDYKDRISGKGYAKGYLPLNIRASNEYRDRTAVAYVANRYFNPVIKNFFAQKGIEVDEDAYALSEMLQFLWRSAVRDGKKITVYVPSKRMRTLLENWIKEQTPPSKTFKY